MEQPDTEQTDSVNSNSETNAQDSKLNLGARDSPQRGSGGSKSSRRSSLCRDSPNRGSNGSKHSESRTSISGGTQRNTPTGIV